MRCRMGPALVFRSFPDRFGRSLRPHASCGIERDTEIVAQRRLAELAQRTRIFIALEAPLSRNIRRIRLTGRLSLRANGGQDDGNQYQREYRPEHMPPYLGVSLALFRSCG